MQLDGFSEEEIADSVKSLVEKGVLEVVGLDEDGEPLFELTEQGKALMDEMVRQNIIRRNDEEGNEL